MSITSTNNPILPGFNADPSIIRVGYDYYIAVSTFTWFPGVAVYHSRNLQDWVLTAHPLNRREQLDITGMGSSCGVWAPCLKYDAVRKRFILVYTVMKNIDSVFFDLDNYILSADSITGPWSDPVYLNSSGFDPSILIDTDGTWYLLNLEWEFRQNYEHPGRIVMQEIDSDSFGLKGSPETIFTGGTDRGCLEGPNLYRIGEYYFLLTAEGGTGYGHSISAARSEHPFGPYVPYYGNPLLSASRHDFYGRNDTDFLKPHLYNPDVEIQKTGHASITDTPDGKWLIVYHGARPLKPSVRCVLGRETWIATCCWTEDGWLSIGSESGEEHDRLLREDMDKGSAAEADLIEGGLNDSDISDTNLFISGKLLKFSDYQTKGVSPRMQFDGPDLPVGLYTLRIPPLETWMSFKERPGWLTMTGQESLHSRHNQSLIARRIQHFDWEAETCLLFYPKVFQQQAGLIIRQGEETWYYLRIYYSWKLQAPSLGITVSDHFKINELSLWQTSIIYPDEPVYLKAIVHGRELQFSYRQSSLWKSIGPPLDQSTISDEYNRSFAGAFTGICCQDTQAKQAKAHFQYFTYRAL